MRYVAVDDCGPAINPLLIDGQVHGGVVHAIGQALYERIHYDEDGQLVTGTFVDYALPSAADVPNIETDRTETPSPINSLGVKGIGEAGTIAASAAVSNAVVDALRPLGVTYVQMPLTPNLRVGGDPGGRRPSPRRSERGRCAVIPAEFDYVAPTSLDEALSALREGGEDAKLLAGGHSLIPLMRLRLAAPTLLVDLAARAGARRDHARERRLADRRDDPPPRGGQRGGARRGRAGGEHDRRPAGPQPRHARRLARARRPGVGHAGGPAGGRGVGRDPRRRRASARWPPPTCSRTT